MPSILDIELFIGDDFLDANIDIGISLKQHSFNPVFSKEFIQVDQKTTGLKYASLLISFNRIQYKKERRRTITMHCYIPFRLLLSLNFTLTSMLIPLQETSQAGTT